MRYPVPAVVLHWLTAALLAVQLLLGLAMADGAGGGVAHAMVGLSILGVTLVRIAVRVGAPAPGLPMSVSKLERWCAKAGHLGLYGCLIAAPLSGIAAWRVERPDQPIPVVGALTAPAPGGSEEAMLADAAVAAEADFPGHGWIVLALVALVALHTLAVAKHRIADGVDLFERMSLGRRKP